MSKHFTSVALALLIPACGGGRSIPTIPSTPPLQAPTPTPIPPILAGTVLTLVSGETDAPVAGASVTLAGATLETSSGGQVVVGQTLNIDAPLDVTASGFLDRQTLLRSPAETRFTLWPRTSPTGLTDTYTATLVYTQASDSGAQVGGAPLERLRPGSPPFILLSASVGGDPAAVAAHQEAVGALAAATQGQVVYTMASERPSDGTVFESSIDPRDENCDAMTRAFTSIRVRSGEILGGRIVFCSEEAARSPTVAHELGHTFGLQHSPDPRELMFRSFGSNRNTSFGAREALSMRLMLQRRGGNLFPDNDRGVTVSGERTRTIVCY